MNETRLRTEFAKSAARSRRDAGAPSQQPELWFKCRLETCAARSRQDAGAPSLQPELSV